MISNFPALGSEVKIRCGSTVAEVQCYNDAYNYAGINLLQAYKHTHLKLMTKVEIMLSSTVAVSLGF